MSDEEVAAWLRDNPAFFENHPELIPQHRPDNILPLDRGRLDQLSREKSSLKSHLQNLLAHARRNEEIYREFFTIQAKAIKAKNLAGVLKAVAEPLEANFGVDLVTVTLADNPPDSKLRPPTKELPKKLRRRLSRVDYSVLAALFGPHPQVKIRIGQEGVNRALFFGENHTAIRSEALVPLLLDGRLTGSLNLGAANPARFLPSYSSDLLVDLAEVLTLCLKKVAR